MSLYQHRTTPEFSSPLSVERIPAAGIRETLVASPQQRADLIKRLGLLDLPKLTAELEVTHAPNQGLIKVKGLLEADVVQQCVVTLEPLPQKIKTKIDVVFAREEHEVDPAGMLDLAPDEGDLDYIHNGQIDLGELVTQHLGISLDPYPRKAGLAPVEIRIGEDDAPQNPFVKLAEWKKKPKDSGDEK